MDTLFTRRHLAAALAAPASLLAQLPQTAAARPSIWLPDRIQWQRQDKDGSRYAVIDGDRDRPGQPFTYAFWMPSGLWVPAHSHTQQAHVAVMKGTLLLGFGPRLDREQTVPVHSGSFFIVRAGEPHFEGSAGETLIIGTALGGWRTTELE